ncbi:YcaO-like family protein [Streptomyces sp. NPDC101151]|uniref:YcaO-like family protein n=1 Tax=Streptomyces sp. NPDC101151 TaxID=3366115 RepID=UPI00380A4628
MASSLVKPRVDIDLDGETERTMPLSASQIAVGEVLTALGLRAELRSFGGDPTAWECRLLRVDDTLTGTGFGKGASDSARVGSIFEALEYYAFSRFALNDVALCSPTLLLKSALASDAAIHLLARLPRVPMAVRTYTSFLDNSTSPGPLFLHSPWYVEDSAAPIRACLGDNYNYLPLVRHSSTNGVAVGLAFEEAAVHALNEVIERDALSLFLIRSVIRPTPARVLTRDSLPTTLQELLRSIEDRLRSEVTLVNITTDLGVPSVLAVTTPSSQGVPRYGAGASLSMFHAATRACTELLQVALLRERPGSVAEFHVKLNALSEYPLLQRCARLGPHLLRRVTPEPFTDTVPPSTPGGHLARIIDTLADNGYDPHLAIAEGMPAGIYACHALIPGLEHFMLVLAGHPLAPGDRGLAASKLP